MNFKSTLSQLDQKIFWIEYDVTSSLNEEVNTPFFIKIDQSRVYQTHIGFGGAFTESAGYVFSKLPKEKKDQIIKDYFSDEGLAYNMGRTHINSCDFSLENYDYITPFDTSLQSFDLSREDLYVIPMIKEAQKYTSNLKLLASPWSPPYWMKTNHMMNHGGKLLAKYRDTWAKYYVKYIEEMKKRDISIWAITVQNEPAAVQTWDSCIYSAEEERDFVKDFLGPTIHAYNKNIKILGWDHNRDIIIDRAKVLLDDEKTNHYLWGIAHHWYVSEAFSHLSVVHDLYPDKHFIFTEGCVEGGPKPGEWHTGLRYARNIIGDLNNHVEGWIEWNLVLDMQGGPNHVGNYCDAPILVDIDHKTYLKNSSYYAIGHFSKFIHEGAKRVHYDGNLQYGVSSVVYQNPGGEMVIILLNENEADCVLDLLIDEKKTSITLKPRSIVSLLSQ